MTLPTAVLKVALALGPDDTPSSGDWTDLSDRVLRANWRRGRSDVFAEFGPGTLSVVLDNSDGALTPTNPDGLVYEGDDLGLPLCPVTLDVTVGGTDYRCFTGFLGPDCWIGRPPISFPVATVELQAVDLLGFPPTLPAYAWGIILRQLGRVDTSKTYWHLPMDHGFPVLADGSQIKNRSGSGGYATFSSPAPGPLLGKPSSASLAGAQPDLGCAPHMVMPEDSYITSAAADVMPDGDEANITICLWWSAGATLTTGQVAQIARMEYPGGGVDRWKVQIEDDGECHVYTYDSGGSLIDSDSIPYPSAGGWDNPTPNWHLVIIRFYSGNNLKVWIGGESATLTATSTVYESDLVVGPSPLVNTYVDEVFVVRRSLTDDEVAGLNLAAGLRSAWFGFSHADTMGAYFEAAGRTVTFDDVDQWHVPAPSPDDYGYMGIGIGGQQPPRTIVEAAQIVAGPYGSVWATRDGFLRVRTIDALTAGGDHDADYVTACASFTDEDAALTPPDYRHAGVEVSGPKADQVVNFATCQFWHLQTTGDYTTRTQMPISAEDATSIARFGRRDGRAFLIDWHGWERGAAIVDTTIARYAWPSTEINSLALDATTNADLALWLVQTCELEKAVDVTYTPYGQDPVTVSGLNIQSEDVTLTPTSFTATLGLAKS